MSEGCERAARVRPLQARCRLPEVMDDPALDAARHRHALRGLARLNWWSGSVRILWEPLCSLALEMGRPVVILDVATGAGDVPIGLWHRAQRLGLPLRIEGCDASPMAIEYASQRSAQAGAGVRFFGLDTRTSPFPDGYDVLLCSLFLHHLDGADATALLRKMAQAARRMVLVNDLVRSVSGFALAYAGTRLLTTSEVVQADGPRSVRAAFTVEEAQALAARAGLDGAVVHRRWPCRFLLRWTRS